MEFFIAWYSQNPYEQFTFINRAFGPYWWAYWTMITCNVLSPQIFWFKKARTNIAVLFIVSIFVNIGMWFERFVIIVTSLHRDFLPSSWGMFTPTFWEFAILAGSFGLFFTMFCLFVRFLPVVATAEVKTVLPQADPHHRRRRRTRTALGGRAAGGGALLMGLLSPTLPPGASTSGCSPSSTRRATSTTPARRCGTPATRRWDAHSPFPVHGLDKAMGLGRSRLPYVTLVCGLSGAIGGMSPCSCGPTASPTR